MTAQVTAIPGGSEVLRSGSEIVARPGVRYQIADVDLVAGMIGPVLTQPDLALTLNEPSLGDLTVTLPDGTVLVFLDMIELFGQGTGLADGTGGLAVASLEDVVTTEAGPDDDATPEDGGNSVAVNEASISDPRDFGSVERGGFEVGERGLGGQDEEDDNLILTLPEPIDVAAAIQDPTAPFDPVIPTVDPPPFVVPPSTCSRPWGRPCPSIRWPNEVVGDDGDNTLQGTASWDKMFGLAGADTFEMNLADLPTSLYFADIIADFEDGVDRIILNLNGAGPVTLGLAETSAGTGTLDTVLVVQETGQIVAVLQDVNAAGGATIDYNDITIVP